MAPKLAREWGLKHVEEALVSITTEDPPVPEVPLKTIFCRCTKDCGGGKCECRKAMLNCAATCLHRQGKCLNDMLVVEDDDEDQQELHTTEYEVNMDKEPLPGPSLPKKIKT
ncbi:unnamed protein product [Psylliodes chrysocephalus]|uniref:Tesmin/TSO1-like CXC domain-containing protein n=1 Tax=Psylliodes chrysocephalus TaxID=3402493 RepID=A0A9P0CTH5_9CUCU|nr:unnamed protein product [Psylliodes chrysocephala]